MVNLTTEIKYAVFIRGLESAGTVSSCPQSFLKNKFIMNVLSRKISLS